MSLLISSALYYHITSDKNENELQAKLLTAHFFVTSRYPKRGKDEFIPILQLQVGIAEHRIGAIAMQSRGIIIDLHLVEHVDMGLAGELRGGDIAERLVDVIPHLGRIEAYGAGDAAETEQLAQGLVVALFTIVHIVAHRRQARAVDNLHGWGNQGRGDLAVARLQLDRF